MKLQDDALRFAATDLANGLGCGHLTELDHQVARGSLDRPPLYYSHVLRALQEQGTEHEQAYLEHLRAQGRQIAAVRGVDVAEAGLEETRRLMSEGADVIFQAHLADADGLWRGRADFLVRVEGPTELGDHGYEAVDTKLATETRAGTILQLCLYSDLIAGIQGRAPERMHVVTPGEGFARLSYRVTDYAAYYRLARRSLVGRLGESVASYPEPVEQCDVCRWWERCDQRRRDDDHLSLVAGISRGQRTDLRDNRIDTLEAFAKAPDPLPFKPARGSRESLARAKRQAAMQLRGRLARELVYELVQPVEPERGLSRLPEPSPGDLFFDLEGDPFVGSGGLEYLFGWGELRGGAWHYEHRWARDAAEERAAFEGFIALAAARLRDDPGMHIYHYAPYEPAALKRLAGRYGACVEELDELLRGQRFVDLYQVVRQGVVASVERYSIKDLEPLVGFSRQIELRAVGTHKRAVEGLLQLGHRELPEESAEIVRRYNEDDCRAAQALRDWLEARRAERVDAGEVIARPVVREGEPDEKVSEWLARIQPLEAALLEGLPEEGRDRQQQARWLLAQMLRWHKREDKCVWWERFRLADLEAEDLADERKAIAGLRLEREIDKDTYNPRLRSKVYRYRFEPQELDVRVDDKLLRPVEKFPQLGEVLGIDSAECWVDLKVSQGVDPRAAEEYEGLFASELISGGTMAERLERIAREALEDGGDIAARNPLADKLLGRVPMSALPLALEHPWDAVDHLAGDVLPVQGPPGSGKSYSGARMIVKLVQAGKKVGITANSHAVIENLMRKVAEAASEMGARVPRMMRIQSSGRGDDVVRVTSKREQALTSLSQGEVDVVGGTAWVWSHPEADRAVHTLFVDEAGQMALANAVACASSAENLILLGDPQQLAQPIQATHPDGTEVSALGHLIGDRQVLGEEQGLFLEHTYRLHPDICAFVSELYYEGRLQSAPGRERQRIDGVGELGGSGLRWIPAEHAGCASRSLAEVAQVKEIVGRLLGGGYFTDHEGRRRKLRQEDVLVVAPFNAQVNALRDALPDDAQVGTVDKFQGREAPVVVYSMTSSSAEDAPRGMEFLYDPHRFNVAVSRAQALVILVAARALFNPVVQTPAQMRLANGVARFGEMAG